MSEHTAENDAVAYRADVDRAIEHLATHVYKITPEAPMPDAEKVAPQHDLRARFCRERFAAGREWESGYRCPICDPPTRVTPPGVGRDAGDRR